MHIRRYLQCNKKAYSFVVLLSFVFVLFFSWHIYFIIAGIQLYEGSKPLKDGLSFPVGDDDHNHTVLLQVILRDCYMATSVFMTATVSMLCLFQYKYA